MEKIIKKSIMLLEALKEIYPNSSSTTIRKMLKNKKVLVANKIVVQGNYVLKIGEKITINNNSRTISNKIHVIYEDKYMIAINKPTGLLSVPLDSANSINALDSLRSYYNSSQIYPVHRIDRETSGVLIFARGSYGRSPAAARLRRCCRRPAPAPAGCSSVQIA